MRIEANPNIFGGQSPRISLPSNASPEEVIAAAASRIGFSNGRGSGRIEQFHVVEVREVQFKFAGPGSNWDGSNCTAALIESDQGTKIALFYYRQSEVRGNWSLFFFDPPEVPNQPMQPTRASGTRG